MNEATNELHEGAPRADDGGYDVVVVGAGAAGLNAALLLGRARRKVVVVDAGEPRAQVVTAAGMGSAAGFAINADLVEEEVECAVGRHRLTAAMGDEVR